jgi:hypothetical protein
MENKIINGKVYIPMSSLQNGEFTPYKAWTNIFIDSDGKLYNERTLNGCNPRPAVYYEFKGKYSATLTRPKKSTLTTDDKRIKLTAYKHLILEMLPNPFPTVADALAHKPKPKPKPKPLDEEHEKIDMANLFPDEEYAEQTFSGLQITHRMNLYRDGEYEKWDDCIPVYADKVKKFGRMYYYRPDIEKRFKIYTETETPEISEQEFIAPEHKICLAELHGLDAFDEWFYENTQIYHGSRHVPWESIDGDEVVELVQGSNLELLTHDDLMDLLEY